MGSQRQFEAAPTTVQMKMTATNISVEDDPSNWPKDLQELRTLDNLLRCSICFEYFNIAVLATGCCHNYCSLCARKHITYKAQCPSCAAEMLQSHLKCNRVLDEIVKTFIALRPKLLKILKEYKDMKENRKKQKNQISPYARPKTPTNSKKSAFSFVSKRSLSNAFESTDSDEFEQMPTRKRKILEKSFAGSSTATLTGSGLDSGSEDDQSSLNKAAEFSCCPVCEKKIPLKGINSHLDVCLSYGRRKESLRNSLPKSSKREPAAKRFKTDVGRAEIENSVEICGTPITSNDEGEEVCESLRRKQNSECFKSSQKLATFQKTASNQLLPEVPSERRKKLPLLVVGGLSEQQLRKKLKSFGVSSKGDKKTMQCRLKNYILLYNSQCDAVNPMPVPQMINEVERTEATQKRLDKGNIVIKTFDCSKTDEEKAKFNQDYLIKHKDHFALLIKDVAARRGSNKNRQLEPPENELQSEPGRSGTKVEPSPSLAGNWDGFEGEASISKHQPEPTKSSYDPNQERDPSKNAELSSQKDSSQFKEILDLVADSERCHGMEKEIRGVELVKDAVSMTLHFAEKELNFEQNCGGSLDSPSIGASTWTRGQNSQDAVENRKQRPSQNNFNIEQPSSKMNREPKCSRYAHASRLKDAPLNARPSIGDNNKSFAAFSCAGGDDVTDSSKKYRTNTDVSCTPEKHSVGYEKQFTLIPGHESTPLRPSQADSVTRDSIVISDSDDSLNDHSEDCHRDWSDHVHLPGRDAKSQLADESVSYKSFTVSDSDNVSVKLKHAKTYNHKPDISSNGHLQRLTNPKSICRKKDSSKNSGAKSSQSNRKFRQENGGKNSKGKRSRSRNITTYFMKIKDCDEGRDLSDVVPHNKKQNQDRFSDHCDGDRKGNRKQRNCEAGYNSSALLFDESGTDDYEANQESQKFKDTQKDARNQPCDTDDDTGTMQF